MAKQKKLTKIVDAVKGILGDDVKQKKLKKEKALRSFIGQMEDKRNEIKKDLEKGDLKKDREKVLERHLNTLDKQIKKARRVLKEMES